MLICCDEKHNPSAQLLSINGNYNCFKRQNEQFNYGNNAKEQIWSQIVFQKIKMQNELINIQFADEHFLDDYLFNIEIGDRTNCEGFAARKYFCKLFGHSFTRRTDTVINSALNYGYAIILSMVNRIICIHGYNTSIGINHHDQNNNFNFSCDIMEPFRPIVDLIIYDEMKREIFDSDYKKTIIEKLNITTVNYKGVSYKLQNAIEAFFLDVIKALNGISTIGDLSFDC